jgi:phage-related minor tail protein
MPEFSLGSAELGTQVDLSGLKKGIDQSKADAQSGFSEVGDVIGGALKLGVAAAGAAVVASIAAIGKAAFDVAGETDQATRNIQAQLGTTAEEAERLGDIALQVWGENWFGSIEEAGQAVADIRQQLGDLSDETLKDVAAGVAAIGDTFGADAPQIVNAVKAIRDNFPGTTEQQALDFISAGFQKGLNSSGDFLDSITEYGVQFGSGGATAGQFFSILETGLQGGVLGTDKAADAFKEFRLRIGDGSKATEEALKALGLSELNDDLASGAVTAADAFDIVQGKITSIEDPALRMQVATALIGTQFEDLGDQAFAALDLSKTSLEDLAGSTDSLNAKYDTLGSAFEGLGRQALVALEPLGEELLGLVNEAMPIVEEGFAWLSDELPGIIEGVKTTIGGLVETVSSLFSGDLATSLDQTGIDFEAIAATIQGVMDGIGAVVGAVLEQVSIFWAENGAEIMAFVQTAWAEIASIVNTAVELIQLTIVPILQGIATFIGEHSTEIQTILSGAWTTIQSIIDIALALIGGILRTALALVKGDWSGAWEEVKNTADRIWKDINTIVDTTINTIKTVLGGAWEEIQKAASGAWEDLKGTIETTKDDIVKTLEELPGKMLAIGEDILGGIKQGILDGWGAFSGWLKDQAQKIIDDFLSTFDISSPSRVFAEEVGEPIVLGILQGMEDLFPMLLDRASQLGEDLLHTLTDIADQVNEALASAFDAEASIDRQLARNLEAVAKLSGTVRGGAQTQLDEALAQAQQMADPEEAAKFFQMRSRQILEAEKLRQELIEAGNAGDTERAAMLEEQLHLIEAANEAERQAFEQRQQGQSETEELQALLAELFGPEGLAGIEGIADIVAELVALANQLGVGTPILPLPAPIPAGPMGIGPLIDGAASFVPAGAGQTIIINQDLRGSSDPKAISDAAYEAAKRALREAGSLADVYKRTRR